MTRRPVHAISPAVAAALLFLPWLAGASHDDPSDSDDTRGVLDVRRVSVSGDARVRWKVHTFAGWGARSIENRGFAVLKLDTFAARRFDYYVVVLSDDGRIEGLLFRDRKKKPDFFVDEVPAWKPTRKTVTAAVELSKLRIGDRRLEWGWRLHTLFTNAVCRKTCVDRVPDDGRITEPVPGATPTIVPTPTISPSVTTTLGP